MQNPFETVPAINAAQRVKAILARVAQHAMQGVDIALFGEPYVSSGPKVEAPPSTIK